MRSLWRAPCCSKNSRPSTCRCTRRMPITSAHSEIGEREQHQPQARLPLARRGPLRRPAPVARAGGRSALTAAPPDLDAPRASRRGVPSPAIVSPGGRGCGTSTTTDRSGAGAAGRGPWSRSPRRGRRFSSAAFSRRSLRFSSTSRSFSRSRSSARLARRAGSRAPARRRGRARPRARPRAGSAARSRGASAGPPGARRASCRWACRAARRPRPSRRLPRARDARRRALRARGFAPDLVLAGPQRLPRQHAEAPRGRASGRSPSTARSSSEWKAITAMRPPGLRQCGRALERPREARRARG